MPDLTMQPLPPSRQIVDPYGRPIVSAPRKRSSASISGSAIDERNPELTAAREFWKKVKDHPVEKNLRDEALKNIGYFTGDDQGWDDDGARAQLEGEGRPALTLNRTHPIIRLICGARPKTKVTYLPKERGLEQTAAVLSACKDNVDDINQWRFKEADSLFRSLVLKRAIIEIKPNYDLDPMGEIELELVNSNNVYCDFDSEKRDRTDQQKMIVVKNVSVEEAKRTFPKHATQLEAFKGYMEYGPGGASRDTSPTDGYNDSRADYYDVETKRISLVYYWYKTYEKVTKIVDVATGKVKLSPLKLEEARQQIAAIPGAAERFTAVEREFTRVNWLVFCHDIGLERGITPWERQDGQNTKLASNFPFIIEELDRIVFGLQEWLIDFMKMLRDPQKYHNKLASSILHIINTQAKGGIDYEKGAISAENKRKLEEKGSKPGVNIEWENLEKMKPRQRGVMPQAEMAVAETMSRELLDISGVESLISTKSLGKNASGQAIGKKMEQGGNIISWVYEYHGFFMFQLADYLRDAIQTMYTYEKTIPLRGDKPKFMTINQKKYDQQAGVTEILNDVTKGRFGTKITEKEDIPTMKLERFKYFADMVKGGMLQLPPQVMLKVVFELMDDPDLKEMVEEQLGEFMAEQQKAAQAAAEAGKQQIKPEVLDELAPSYTDLARSEQAQVLTGIGIQPDPNPGATVGLPDAGTAATAQSKGMESQAKAQATIGKSQIDARIKAQKADQDLMINRTKAAQDLQIARESADQSLKIQRQQAALAAQNEGGES